MAGLFSGAFAVSSVQAQFVANYDESQVPEYTLPDPLVFENGDPVESPEDWKQRRAEILHLFEQEVYGTSPLERPEEMRIVPVKRVEGFLDGKALLQEFRILLFGDEEGPHLDLLLITPAEIPEEGAPTFLTLNFDGNHSIHPSEDISLPTSWMRHSRGVVEAGYVKDHVAQPEGRGFKSSRWPVEMIIDAGCGLATFYYGDIDPDVDDGFENGIHAVTGKPGPNEWGSIASWAWGCRRALDCLETVDEVDASKVAVFGHSRLGKTALWAGATDERFALVISNNSGCGGAALSRRRFGERVTRINGSFPHWFTERFRHYNGKEHELPVDQHQLIALIAPRPVCVGSAVEDQWADPKGEFLSALHADPVYRLLGTEGIGETAEQPGLHQPVGATLRYHLREGGHGVEDYDWERYIAAMNELVR